MWRLVCLRSLAEPAAKRPLRFRSVQLNRFCRRGVSILPSSSVVRVEAEINKGAKVMKYMLLVYHDEQSWNPITEAERQDI